MKAEVAEKAAFVRDALQHLGQVPQTSYDDFLSDDRNLPATLHWLQTAIQGLVDVGLKVSSAAGLPPARTSVDVLERLEEADLRTLLDLLLSAAARTEP